VQMYDPRPMYFRLSSARRNEASQQVHVLNHILKTPAPYIRPCCTGQFRPFRLLFIPLSTDNVGRHIRTGKTQCSYYLPRWVWLNGIDSVRQGSFAPEFGRTVQLIGWRILFGLPTQTCGATRRTALATWLSLTGSRSCPARLRGLMRRPTRLG
jgi:hypothetical protein